MGMMAFFTRRDPAAWAMRPETQREAIVGSLLAWAWAVEARDPWTGGHLWRVARYTELLADRAGMAPQERAQVALAAFVHDLGKLAVPDAILCQREPLSEADHAVMRTHPEMGARLLAGHPYGPLVHDIVLLHHETPDGRGYPRGLSGPTIPTGARIVGLCDAFDAMTTRRPWRDAMSVDEALSAIEVQLGRQFDDFLGRHFLALAREGALQGIIGHSDEGMPMQHCASCGPTMVQRREHRVGEHLHCPVCGARHRLAAAAEAGAGRHSLIAEPTGAFGSPMDLLTQPDHALIRRFVQDTVGLAVQAGYAPT